MQRFASFAILLPVAAAHGFVSSPAARRPGDAYRATCGEQPFFQQSADINGNVQGIQQVVGSDKTDACNLWLCKGFLLEDNQDKVQSYSLGQTIDFQVNIAAPHTGYANVSVVKTSTNSIIGDPLIEFQNYASNAGVAANNTAFSVTLPASLGGDCTTAGDCVLQWFWDAPDIDQTYEACVDFTVSGSGSGSSPAPTSAAASTSVPAATSTGAAAAPTSSIDAVPTTTSAGTAPTATSTPVPGDEGDDGDECPADDGEDDGDDDDSEECPADDGEDDDDEGDDDECPADDGEDVEETSAPAAPTIKATTTAASAPAETNGAGSFTSTITQVVTSTVTTERLVTVTAPATACN